MKKVVLTAALVAAASGALAGINPLNAGLPSFTMSAGRGYGAVVTTGFPGGQRGNFGSSMCVECHSVNPSPHITAPAGVGIDNTAVNWGTHTVLNSLTATAFVDFTNSGGGFLGGRTLRDGGEYMAKVAWATGGISKYNTGASATTLTSVNGTAVTDWAAADMICESCHNILTNGGNQLLLGAYADTATPDDTLCVVCHDGGADNVAANALFHANGNLNNFNRTRLKRHHVLQGDTLDDSNYDPDGIPASNDSVMWAPQYSDKLDTTWCATPYTNIVPGIVLTHAATGGPAATFRNACNVGGAGTRLFSALFTNADMRVASATDISCVNCHRPHNAKSGAGAFIFRTGGGAAAGGQDYPGVAGTSGTTAGTIGWGIRRQADVGDWTVSTSKIYGEYVRLCNGCHIGYGQ